MLRRGERTVTLHLESSRLARRPHRQGRGTPEPISLQVLLLRRIRRTQCPAFLDQILGPTTSTYVITMFRKARPRRYVQPERRSCSRRTGGSGGRRRIMSDDTMMTLIAIHKRTG